MLTNKLVKLVAIKRVVQTSPADNECIIENETETRQ